MSSKPLNIQVPLGANHAEIVFNSFREVDEWLKLEEPEWQWLFEIKHFPQNPIANTVNIYRNTFSQIRNTLDAALTSSNDADLDQHTANVTKHLEYVRQRRMIVSTDSEFGVLTKLRDSNINACLWALHYCTGNQVDIQQRDALEGIVRIALSDIGVSDSAYGQKKSLNKLKDRYQREFKNLKESYQSLVHEFELDRDNHAKTYTDQQSKLNEIFDQTREKIRELEETYDEKLALLKPVEYWALKAKRRYKIAAWSALGFIGSSAALLLISIKLFSTWLGSEDIWSEPWRITTVAVFIGLMVWVIRLVARFMQRQLSIADDAQERATMVVTYLSLLRSGEGLEDNDRTLILNALFRTSNFGISSDDMNPSTVLEMAGRILGGNK